MLAHPVLNDSRQDKPSISPPLLTLKAILPGKWSVTYRYRDSRLKVLTVCQEPKNDDQAVEYLWAVYDRGDAWEPVYVERQSRECDWILLPWKLNYGHLFIEIVPVKE